MKRRHMSMQMRMEMRMMMNRKISRSMSHRMRRRKIHRNHHVRRCVACYSAPCWHAFTWSRVVVSRHVMSCHVTCSRCARNHGSHAPASLSRYSSSSLHPVCTHQHAVSSWHAMSSRHARMLPWGCDLIMSHDVIVFPSRSPLVAPFLHR